MIVGSPGPFSSNEEQIVNRPAHYNTGAVECLNAIESAVQGLEPFEAVLTGNCLKYLWRWKKKNPESPSTDLKKCRYYLDQLITLTENPKNG